MQKRVLPPCLILPRCLRASYGCYQFIFVSAGLYRLDARPGLRPDVPNSLL